MPIRSRPALVAVLGLVLSAVGAQADGIDSLGIPAGQLPGTQTNDNANAGNVGELISSSVVVGSAVSLTTTTPANITSVSLTAGDWDCYANAVRHLGATTSITLLKTTIGTTTAADGTLGTTMTQFATAANVNANDHSEVIGPVRESLSATTTVFLVADDTFTVSTNAGYGQLRCRRVR